jgi:hypothetical protein
MIRALRVLAVGGLLLAACGGSDDKATGTLTVKEIASATRDATTFRFSTETRFEDGVAGTPYTGEVDGNGNASMVIAQPETPGEFDWIWSDRHVYNRLVSPPEGLEPYDWCEKEDVKFTEGYAGVQPFDTLAGLDAENRSLRRVETDRVRGAATVHYTIEGSDPPVDLWVDDDDRLRRLVWTHNEGKQTDTVELYDFGAPIQITVPRDAPPCPKIPPGWEGHCLLGRSHDELPKCPDDAETP